MPFFTAASKKYLSDSAFNLGNPVGFESRDPYRLEKFSKLGESVYFSIVELAALWRISRTRVERAVAGCEVQYRPFWITTNARLIREAKRLDRTVAFSDFRKKHAIDVMVVRADVAKRIYLEKVQTENA